MNKNEKAQVSEIEKEAKNLLENEEFKALREHFCGSTGGAVQQINKYFDTPNQDILNRLPPGTTLRVRNKEGKDSLEFKLPATENDDFLEYKTKLSDIACEALFEEGDLPDGDVKLKLAELGINGPFRYLGDLVTWRSTATRNNKWDGAVILLDESIHPNGLTDYEIEIESDDYAKSQEALKQIQAAFDIPTRNTPRKIERFYAALK